MARADAAAVEDVLHREVDVDALRVARDLDPVAERRDLGRCGGDMEEIWGRCGGDVGGDMGGDMGEVRVRVRVRVGVGVRVRVRVAESRRAPRPHRGPAGAMGEM